MIAPMADDPQNIENEMSDEELLQASMELENLPLNKDKNECRGLGHDGPHNDGTQHDGAQRRSSGSLAGVQPETLPT